MRINIGIVIFVFALISAFLPSNVSNFLPYFLVGAGLSQLNNYWDLK